MQSKTIRKTIKAKLNEWISTIDDPSLVDMIKRDTIVTGGSIASMLLKEPVNDYDIYFATKETTLAVSKYYVDKFKVMYPDYDIKVDCEIKTNIKGEEEERVSIFIRSGGVLGEDENESEVITSLSETDEVDDEDKYRPVFMTSNAITLSNDIQIVIRFFGEPDEIHSNYDFIHACNWYRFKNNHLELKSESLESLLQKRLVYCGSLYPICSMFRLKKFINRGWNCSAGEMLKIAFQISELDLTDLDVLYDQLIGVDVSYMIMLVDILKNSNADINSDYVAEIIDRLWNEDEDDEEFE